MPELPEVETVARTLAPHICGSTITGVELLRASALHPLSLPLASLTGSRFESTGRRGKLLVFSLSNTVQSESAPSSLVVHLRMTGRLLTQDANQAQGKHTRCIFHLKREDGESHSLFFDDARTFGQILAATPSILEKWDFWRTMGPEPFDMDWRELARRLNRKVAIKSCLLDQKIIAGIGNIYADESLHRAGINPARPANSLSNEEIKRLLKGMRAILRLSIRQCGSSIRDYRDADGNVGSFQNSFAVYGRGGKNCPACGSVLQKIRLGGRATVFCPSCQK